MAQLILRPDNHLARFEDDGTMTLLSGVAVNVWRVSTNASETTVTSATDGVVAPITVAGAVGEVYRLRVTNDGEGRCLSIDIVAE